MPILSLGQGSHFSAPPLLAGLLTVGVLVAGLVAAEVVGMLVGLGSARAAAGVGAMPALSRVRVSARARGVIMGSGRWRVRGEGCGLGMAFTMPEETVRSRRTGVWFMGEGSATRSCQTVG
ncbi:hypothetical protein GCM10009733_071160 [Nonomuraea maheshkhaliensis]|uniref:Uncharacterized protein n=1 Tax=Nonomuraea maheshkhaliensis TaxID=419590 RepID=A0ABP4S1W9_9ACTN